MKVARSLILTGSVGLVASMLAVPVTAMASQGPKPIRVALRGSLTPAVERAHPAGAVPAGSRVSFDLVLRLRNAAGAKSFVREVSSPGSRLFHHYLTDAQWTARFGPTRTSVAAAEKWLRDNGFRVVSVPKTRLYVSAAGTAAKVERAFGVRLGYFMVNGHRVRLAKNTLSIPASLAGAVTGAAGVNEYIATTDLARTPKGRAAIPAQEPPPPAGFRNPKPCSAFWGEKTDTVDNGSLYAPYTAPLPYDICGYKPAQLRGGYGLTSSVASGNNGTGVTIAIVDAYDSPTLFKDAAKYFSLNDPSSPLTAGQFFNLPPATVTNAGICDGSGWFAEQALDVESSHAMAPGANILFVGAQDCFDTNLLAALGTAITSGASVVSDSWGDPLGDVFVDAATHTAFDNTFMLADSTGVSVLFSSGDFGDNFADFGLTIPDFPPTSPFITSVGGTTLEVGASNTAMAEFGWSTAKQILCAPATSKNCGSATTPLTPLKWQAGGGGGTSYFYTQPFYQARVVPAALALRNEALFGPVPLRVEPDISLDADAQSGMLIGLTQTFPNGVHYGQFKEGGTSLASPLLAGVIADTDQAAGSPLGFLNPVLYKAFTRTPSAFNDIVPPANPNATAVIRVDFANTVNKNNGFLVSLRAIDYQGPETFCDGTGNCATRNVTLSAAPGFDSLTGLGSIGPDFISTLSKF